MNRDEILHRLDDERRELVYDGAVLEILPHLTRYRSADHSHHAVLFSRLTAESADRAIDDEIAHHRALNAGFEWKLYTHDAPADLLARLERRGFSIGPCEAVLVYDLSRLADWMKDESVRVERVDREDQLPAYRAIAEEVFGKDYTFTTSELAAAIRAGSMQHRAYVAYHDGKPASIGRLYTHPRSHFAGLYGGGTLSGHRGQGLYRATVAARARGAIALGAIYLQVDALPTSRPILERLGFVWITDTYPCEWRV